ncbi:MAG: thiamine phosphate synthase [Pseudomonadota bacterium]|nr:thiamine phosphate synthase [Pseudomonadota bacterium]
MTRPGIDGLYAITPDVHATSSLAAMTRQVLMGGARLIQYRNKTAGIALRLEQARLLAHLCRKFSVPFIINDHLDLAVEAGADGMHLGQEDVPLAEARRRLGHGKIIGVSCYDRLELAIEAERQGADYVAFGAFFASITKPGAAAAPIDLLRQAKRILHIPVVAIGGMTSDNAVELIRLGTDAVAASNALYGAANIRSATEKFSRLFNLKYSLPHKYELSNDLT